MRLKPGLFQNNEPRKALLQLKPELFQDHEPRKARVVQLKSGLFQDHEPRLSGSWSWNKPGFSRTTRLTVVKGLKGDPNFFYFNNIYIIRLILFMAHRAFCRSCRYLESALRTYYTNCLRLFFNLAKFSITGTLLNSNFSDNTFPYLSMTGPTFRSHPSLLYKF